MNTAYKISLACINTPHESLTHVQTCMEMGAVGQSVYVEKLEDAICRYTGAKHAIVTNGDSARWIEDGPRLANAENVGKLGRDIAIYGYGVTAAYLPAGIVRLQEP